MKIRTGYVSNSSSSSFCIVGYKHCNTNNIDKYDFDFDKNQYVMMGMDLSEGMDVVILNESIVQYLKSHTIEYDYDIIQTIAYERCSDNNNFMHEIPEIILKPQIYFGTVSDAYTRTLKEFKNRYSIIPF